MLTNTLPTVPPDDRVRIKKWLLKPTTPSPSRISRMFRTLEDRRANQHGALREQGIRLSLEDNRFSRAKNIYSKKNQIVGDGTVLKAATSHRGGEVVDFATGEIRARRHRFPVPRTTPKVVVIKPTEQSSHSFGPPGRTVTTPSHLARAL